MMEKSLIRKEIKARKTECSLAAKHRLSLLLQQRLMRHPRWIAASNIYLYAALPDEVETNLLLQSAITEGKCLLLPRVEGDDLVWVNIHQLSDLHEGAFHILEPQGEAIQTQTKTQTQTQTKTQTKTQTQTQTQTQTSLAIIPGIAFTQDGKRLGRGKGFYDRFLTQHPHLYKIGICWPFQIEEDLPTEPHDIKMDEVLY